MWCGVVWLVRSGWLRQTSHPGVVWCGVVSEVWLAETDVTSWCGVVWLVRSGLERLTSHPGVVWCGVVRCGVVS